MSEAGSTAEPSTDGDETVHVTEHAASTEHVDVGRSLARYVVLEELGHGGMGTVLRAYDPKLQREVALKRLHGDTMDAARRERLVAEARAMAMLSHPNVVAVFDVEALPGDELMLVMEYVPGQTFAAWLKDRGDSHAWPEALDLLLQAGRGLAAAHAAGITHRDFKPSNVMVAQTGAVKVTDFGIAKGAGGKTRGESVDARPAPEQTAEGTLMGTPRYMAPEQHEGAEVTAAADQYAFCVSLWAALTGDTPFSGSIAELARAKAAGPPQWPRNDVPSAIVGAIVRGLAPEPEARWPSMDALLTALRWNPRRRRSRILWGVAAVAALGLAIGWQHEGVAPCTRGAERIDEVWGDAQRERLEAAFASVDRNYATRAWTVTTEALDSYGRDWAAMHDEACEATTVRAEQSARMLDLRMACLHRATVELRATIDVLAEADEGVVQKAHALTGALPPLQRCADLEALAADVEPPAPREAAAVERTREIMAQAKSERMAGRYARAREVLTEARAALEGVEYVPVWTELTLLEGEILERLGDYEAARVRLEEALRTASTSRDRAAMQRAASRLMYVLGDDLKKTDDALRYRALAEGLSIEGTEGEARFRSMLGSVLASAGRVEEALQEYRAALELRASLFGDDDLRTASVRGNLGIALYRDGRLEEAVAELRKTLETREANLGPEHPDVATSRNNVAGMLLALGEYAEAERELRIALRAREAALGPEHPSVATTRDNLGSVIRKQGRTAESEMHHRTALRIFEDALGPEHPEVARVHNNLGVTLADLRRDAEAVAEYRASLEIWTDALGPDHPDIAKVRNNIALLLMRQEKYQAAEREFRATLAILEEAMGDEHPSTAACRFNLARALLAKDGPAAAREMAERAWSRRQRSDIRAEDRAGTAFLMARITWALAESDEDRARARALAEQALQTHQRSESTDTEQLDEIRAWLEANPAP